jgi:protein CpxP
MPNPWNPIAPRRGLRVAACAMALALAGASMSMAQTPTAAPAGPGAWSRGASLGSGVGWGGGWGWGHGRGAERMLDAVSASADQKAKVRQIFDALRSDLHAQFDHSRSLHDEMAKLLLAPTLDSGAVEALRQKLMAQQDAASKRVTQAMLDASAVLTPEQRQKLAAYLQKRREMFERHRRERESLDAPKG